MLLVLRRVIVVLVVVARFRTLAAGADAVALLFALLVTLLRRICGDDLWCWSWMGAAMAAGRRRGLIAL